MIGISEKHGIFLKCKKNVFTIAAKLNIDTLNKVFYKIFYKHRVGTYAHTDPFLFKLTVHKQDG